MRRTAMLLLLALLLVPLSGTIGEAATPNWLLVWDKAVDASSYAQLALSGLGYGGPAGYVAVGSVDNQPAILTSRTAAKNTWQWANINDPRPFGEGELLDVVYSADHKQYVAVGNGDILGDEPLIIVSDNGVDWTVVQGHGLEASPSRLHAVAYGNGVYVAVGTNFFAWSPDGLNWHHVPGTDGGVDAGGNPIHDPLDAPDLQRCYVWGPRVFCDRQHERLQ